jgi:hypothetical protein
VDFEIVIGIGQIRRGTNGTLSQFPVADVDISGLSAMQRRVRANWTPVIVSNTYRIEDDKAGKGEGIFSGARPRSPPGVQTQEEEKLADNRLMIAAAIAIGLPAVISVSLYMTATIILRVI